jgi:hypothetical protein
VDILAQVLGKEQAAENSNFGSFVTGHDYSRTDKANKINWI